MKKRVINLLLIAIIIQLLILTKMLINEKLEKIKNKIEIKSIDYILNPKIGKTSNFEDIINYEIIIEIPAINLKKGILNKEDKNNNIDKNVTLLKESSYPNEDGNIYIAAHSGTGNHSYFNDLKYLKIKDQVYLYHQDIKYVYEVSQIKNISKHTYSSIVTSSKNNLILITCNQKDKSKYLVVILNKTKKQN